jgi:hypothetical protein
MHIRYMPEGSFIYSHCVTHPSNYLCIHSPIFFLGVFSTYSFRSVTICFAMPVHTHNNLRTTNCTSNKYDVWGIFLKFAGTFQFWLQSDKSNNTLHKDFCALKCNSLNIYQNRKMFWTEECNTLCAQKMFSIWPTSFEIIKQNGVDAPELLCCAYISWFVFAIFYCRIAWLSA